MKGLHCIIEVKFEPVVGELWGESLGHFGSFV